jgi:hypothetical protein
VLDRFELVFEDALRNLEHDVAEHLEEPAVAVVRESSVSCPSLQALGRPVVQAKVENRVHHPGHGKLGSGPDGYEQRVVNGTKDLSGRLFELLHGGGALLIHFGGKLPLALVVEIAYLCRDGEPGRYRQTRIRHLRQSGALASEGILHGAIAVGFAISEEVDELLPAFCRAPGANHDLQSLDDSRSSACQPLACRFLSHRDATPS